MTNTIDTTLDSVMFSPAGQSKNNLLNQSSSKALEPSPGSKENVSPPSLLAGQIVSSINRASSLSPTFKREAIMLTAMVDAVAPAGTKQNTLGAVSAGIGRQEQRALEVGVQAQQPLRDPQNLFDQTQEAVLNPGAQQQAQQQGEDAVSLTPEARARVLGEGFEDPQMVDMLRNLGSEAVATIFGEPPGVRGPEQSRLPESARLAAPQEIREERAALRESILKRITGGKLPE